MRILILEDNLTLANGLKSALEQAGYAVDLLHDGQQGANLLKFQVYDLLLLDLGLPSIDGIDLLRQLRRANNALPVLIISARDQLDHRIEGLDVGADDYICKPFELDEVVARTRALLRRSTQKAEPVIQHGRLEFATVNRQLTVDGNDIELHRRELSVLEYILTHPGRVISKEQIAEHISSFDDDINPVAIETYISRLRKKLGEDLNLKTVRGLGYLLELNND